MSDVNRTTFIELNNLFYEIQAVYTLLYMLPVIY